MFQTPILFLIFNRPTHAQLVFDRIREMKPVQLFIAADGPRKNHPDDEIKCKLTRESILGMIEWECEVKTLFRHENLGCSRAVSESITWFFSHVHQGIILEDDCLPELSFFTFCESLLNHYKNTPQVMHISGNNFQNGMIRDKYSYYFSAYTHNWGWATWRDRWAFFDLEIPHHSDQTDSFFDFYKFSKVEIQFWKKTFRILKTSSHIDTWDFSWMYSVWMRKGISILPQVNLIKNIGFDQYATHTHGVGDQMDIGTGRIDQIIHPPTIILNREADYYTLKNHFNPQPKKIRAMANLLYKAVKKIYSLLERPIAHRLQFKRFRDFTMIPKSIYLNNLDLCAKFKGIKGDVVECGTWKGGMIAGMVGIMGTERTYYLFDSFEGLPEVKEIDGIDAKAWQSRKDGVDYFDNCKADESVAKEAMKRSGAKHYRIHKGWFNETLPSFSSSNGIAVLRLDADWYDSTMDCLVHLFPKLNVGGVLILDDYYTWEGCAKAVHDYLSANKLPCRIYSHKSICYIVKR